MQKRNLRSIVAVSIFLLLACHVALASETAVDEGTNDVTILINMINWSGVAISVMVIIFTWLFLRITNNVVTHLGNIFAERRLLLHKINAFLRFGIYIFTGVIVVLQSFEFSREVLAVLGGGTAVAFGFAAKDLVASLVAGIMIIVDRPFQVGDRVNFGDQYGDIISIGLRSVKLQTLDDSTVTIPNNMFLNNITSCGNYGVLYMQVLIDLHIGIDQDVRLARDLAQEAAATSCFVYLQKLIKVSISQEVIGQCVAFRLRVKAYVLDTKYEKQMVTDITIRALEAFAKNDIHPPAILLRNVTSQNCLSTDASQMKLDQYG
jgi:small-conductance mechanosensitive channel